MPGADKENAPLPSPPVAGPAMPIQTGLSGQRQAQLATVDLAVVVGCWMQALPKPEEMERLAEHWQPYRSLGSWYMWRLCEVRTRTLLCFSTVNECAIDFRNDCYFVMMLSARLYFTAMLTKHQERCCGRAVQRYTACKFSC